MRIEAKAAVLSVVAVVAGIAPVASPGAAARDRTRTFTVEGAILGPTVLTHLEFIASCPRIPASQGVTGYVVEVPEEFVGRPSRARVEATAVSLDPGIELSFYSVSCDQMGLLRAPPVTVPENTGFIVVEDTRGGAVEFELTLTQRR